MDQAKHTPTPWKTHIANDVLIVDVNGVDVAEICGEYDVDYEAMSDNAAIIVRAVNSFEAMTEALNAGIKLRNFFAKSPNAGPMTTDPSREAKLMREFYQKIDLARSALAKATGEA